MSSVQVSGPKPRLLEPQVQRAVAHLRSGLGVALNGAPGSGRSTLLDEVVEELERTGTTVLTVKGLPLLGSHPYIALEAVLPGPLSPQASPVDITDRLAKQLYGQGDVVIALDNIADIDHASLGVLNQVHSRLNIPFVLTGDLDPTWARDRATRLTQRWIATTISLSPLRYDQMAELLPAVLHGPVQDDLISHVLTKSAGNPGLGKALALTARLHGTIGLNEGKWVLKAASLWHDDLGATVQAMIPALDDDVLATLFSCGLLGPSHASRLERLLPSHHLRILEELGLVVLVGSSSEDPIVSVHPPVLEDYIRANASAMLRRHVLKGLREIEGELAALPQMETPVAQLNVAEDIALARLFDEQARTRSHALFRIWQADPTAEHALTYLTTVWDINEPPAEIKEVLNAGAFQDTDDPSVAFILATMRADWAAHPEHDLPRACQILAELADEYPELAGEAGAYSLFLEAITTGLPSDYEEQLEFEAPAQPGSIAPIVLAFLYLADLRPRQALDVLDSGNWTRRPLVLTGLGQMVRILALHYTGHSQEALKLSSEAYTEARRQLDKPGMLSIGYARALILIQRGEWDKAEKITGTIFSGGRPGLVTGPIYASLLRLAALFSILADRHERALEMARSAEQVPVHNSALPGMDSSFSVAIPQVVAGDYGAAIKSLEEAARQQLDNGYKLGALSTLHIAAALFPSPKIAQMLEDLTDSHEFHRGSTLVRLVKALSALDYPALYVLLPEIEEGIETTVFVCALWAALASDQGDPVSIQNLLSEVLASFPSARFADTAMSHMAVKTLSEREFEVALLVGRLGNATIAQRLHLSVRTVENHVYKAMRKVGASTREELYTFAAAALHPSFQGE
ncbi:LuxR C-terminal-related transcriptional regulator [Actinomycetaceae bacterium L2_0104]